MSIIRSPDCYLRTRTGLWHRIRGGCAGWCNLGHGCRWGSVYWSVSVTGLCRSYSISFHYSKVDLDCTKKGPFLTLSHLATKQFDIQHMCITIKTKPINTQGASSQIGHLLNQTIGGLYHKGYLQCAIKYIQLFSRYYHTKMSKTLFSFYFLSWDLPKNNITLKCIVYLKL